MVEERLRTRVTYQYFGVERKAFYYTSSHVDFLLGERRKRKGEKEGNAL